MDTFRLSLSGDHRRSLAIVLAGLVLLGLLLALGHVSAASPVEHADCPVCKTFHQFVLTLPQLATVQVSIVVAVLLTTVRVARGRTPLLRRGRAPPRSSPV
jgi:hypothetical protein